MVFAPVIFEQEFMILSRNLRPLQFSKEMRSGDRSQYTFWRRRPCRLARPGELRPHANFSSNLLEPNLQTWAKAAPKQIMREAQNPSSARVFRSGGTVRMAEICIMFSNSIYTNFRSTAPGGCYVMYTAKLPIDLCANSV